MVSTGTSYFKRVLSALNVYFFSNKNVEFLFLVSLLYVIEMFL